MELYNTMPLNMHEYIYFMLKFIFSIQEQTIIRTIDQDYTNNIG